MLDISSNSSGESDQIIEFVIIAEEEYAQLIPPPCSAVLLLIVQFVIIGEEDWEQPMPPPY
jgi:hypothetical protein